jgi:hypothetical protein
LSLLVVSLRGSSSCLLPLAMFITNRSLSFCVLYNVTISTIGPFTCI